MATALAELIKDIEGKKLKSVQDRLKKDKALVSAVYKTKTGTSNALHIAIKQNSLALVDALLAAGADVGAADSAGNQALHIACGLKGGDASAIIKALLKKKAKTDALNAGKESPWHIAAATGSSEAIAELTDAPGAAGLDSSAPGQTPVVGAVLANHHAATAALVQAGAKLTTQDAAGATALMHLLVAGRVGDAQRLLDTYDCNVNATGTAAPVEGLTALLMVVPGANDLSFSTPGAAALITTLLEKGASPDVQMPGTKDTPLTWAIANKHAELAQQLIKKTKQFSLRNSAGHSAIDIAISTGQDELVSALIGAGAPIDDPDNMVKSALDGGKDTLLAELVRACKKAQLESAGAKRELLLEKYPFAALAWIEKFERSKASDTQTDVDGNTWLHTLAESGAPYQLVLGLIRLGMGANTQNAAGDAPLHVAARCGHVEVCRALVDGGADVLKRNGKNRRPREVPKIPDNTRDFLMAAEDEAKEKKLNKDKALWDDKMRGTQTESACACGVL